MASKIDTNEFIYEQKQTHRQREQTCGSSREGMQEEMDRDFGVNRCILLCVEWINARSYCIAEGPIFNILG